MTERSKDQKLPPVWLVKAINCFRTSLLFLNRKLFPGKVVLYEQFQYLWLLPSLYVAAKLDIAGCLNDSPMTSEEIAGRVSAHPPYIFRLLRALSSQGIFKQNPDGRFAINALAKGLLDEPGSLRHMILHHLGPVNWNLMGNLEYAIRTGNDAFSDKYGKGIYDYLRDHPDESVLFDKSMSDLSSLGLAPIIKAYNFSGYPVIADLGGGEGFLLANILWKNPGCKGILYDLPEALEKANDMLCRYRVQDRVQVVPGDFFKSVPADADLYLLKNVIHNWSDEQSSVLLSNINKVIGQNARLILIEMVIPAGNRPSLGKLIDIQMMATLKGAKERTGTEYRSLLEKSGFTLLGIIPTIAPICLIEAKKRD